MLMHKRSPLFWLLAIVSTPFIVIILIIVFAKLNDMQLSLRGYHVMSTGWELGRILAQDGSPANECLKFRSPTFDIMTPSRGEHVGMCVREYAELTKDPSACELLMPSSYGLSCVGGARKNLPCLFDDQKNVVWNDGKYNEIPFGECSKTKLSKEGAACCLAAAAKFDPDFIKGCEAFRSSNPLLADQCQYEVAQKEIDPVLCGTIADENIRSACNLVVTTLLKNPELRSNYPFVKQR